MVFHASVEPHLHQEFNFADNSSSWGCCGFWISRSRPREFSINDRHELVPKHSCKYRERIDANIKLCKLVKQKFDNDPIDNDKAFELLKERINDNLNNGEPVTSERLAKIIIAIHELKKEFIETCSEQEKEILD